VIVMNQIKTTGVVLYVVGVRLLFSGCDLGNIETPS
jgi:hypothetical protein